MKPIGLRRSVRNVEMILELSPHFADVGIEDQGHLYFIPRLFDTHARSAIGS